MDPPPWIQRRPSLEEHVRLRLGGGFDAHLPTTSGADATALVAAIRAYEPQLYTRSFASFRGRGSIDLEAAGFRASAELALIPAITTDSPSRFALLAGAAVSVSYLVTSSIEPFLEFGCSTQIAGAGSVRPPFLLTPGVRFHIADFFDPAVFVSANFVASSAVIFGIDLAIAVRSTDKPGRDLLDVRDELRARDEPF